MAKFVVTPRGKFELAEDVLRYQKNGFGYHHQCGDYVVISNGYQAVAITLADYKKYFCS